MPPNSASVSSPSLQQSLYTSSFGHGSDPSIDFLRPNSLHPGESPSIAPVGSSNGILQHHSPHYDVQSITELFIHKTDSILEKARAISRICPPLSSLSVPPFGTPCVTRMPIITVDGDDVDLVSDLYHLLSRELEKSPIQQPLCHIDDPDDPLPVLSDAELEGLLDSTGELEKDNDADAARYLTHVAGWRQKSSEIKSALTQQRHIVLVNRYVLSRCEAAALRLDTDGLSTLEHWQWCATVWKGCVGADMTIFVVALPDGGLVEELVSSKDGGWVLFVGKGGRRKEWGGKLMRRLVFDIGELVRSLRGFPE
jgi:HMG box factor